MNDKIMSMEKILYGAGARKRFRIRRYIIERFKIPLMVAPAVAAILILLWLPSARKGRQHLARHNVAGPRK